MTADSEKSASLCLLCNCQALSPRNSVEIFGDKVVTISEKPFISVLSSILKKSINEKNARSSIMCKKCTKLVNEADELESKLEQKKLEINNLYKKSIKTEVIVNANKNGDEHTDHDYIDNIEIIQSVPLIKGEITIDNKKKSKQIPASHLIQIKTEPASTEGIEIFDGKKEFKRMDENDLSDNDEVHHENITIDSLENSMDHDSQMEEVIIEKEQKTAAPPEDVSELIEKDGINFVCKICDEESRESRDAKAIVTHVKNEHNFRIYVCDICGDIFKKRTDLSHHLDEHVAKEEGDFQCEACNRIFNNLRLFRIHKRIHYPQSKSWSCDTCGKRYSSKNLLEEHQNTHTGNRPYICEECGKDFTSKYTYRAHVKTHSVRPRPHECDICKKTFLSQQNLTQHKKTHNGVKEHICHQCGKAFGSAHNLEVHSIVHSGYKPYICRVCGKAFARKAEIRDHERTHTGEKPYQCELCGATFSQRSNLQSHKRATHFNDKRYKCEECGRGFKRRRLLDYHIKAAHTGERPFKCETCSATFVYPEHFKKHMRIHTGEKPYLCEVCGKAFNSRDNRNAHRFIHSDKKPYECLVCGMGFMRKPLLYTHMQTQGHLNDTIVVNQPRLTTEDDILLPDNRVQLIVQDGEQLDDNTPLYVTELKDHVIIQEGDEQNVLSFADGTEENDETEELEDGQIDFEGSEILECKTEAGDGFEEVYGYQDEDGNTIVIPPGTDISSIIGTENKALQLVQIRLPAGSSFGKNWLNSLQSD